MPEQEECASCEAMIALAEARRIELVAAAFSFVEPYGTLQRRAIARAQLSRQLRDELRELGRTAKFASDVAESALPTLLIQSTQHADGRFESVTDRLLAATEVLPLDRETLAEAATHRANYALTRPDALVLASVLRDPRLGLTPSCFLNRNIKDFADPAIVAELARRQCKLIGRFDHGLQYVQSALA